MHAVEPDLVYKSANWLTAEQIVDDIIKRPSFPWVTYSGGNPALHNLDELTFLLHGVDRKVKLETQGTYWRDWINEVDLIVMSPKPPSAGQYRAENSIPETEFWHRCAKDRVAVKIVVFDDRDLEYASGFAYEVGLDKIWISCGTLATDTRDALGERYAWLSEACLDVFEHRGMQVTVLPQLHVVAYLHRLGV
jgi:7-carboxy-7-deazaguanine synthase